MSSTKRTFDPIDESDRGSVLVVAADIENALEELLRAVFASNRARKRVVDTLFDAMGPLGTFSGKSRVAYSFGLVASTTFDDLDFIRRLRNEAAHSNSEFDLLNHEMAARIDELHCVQAVRSSMPRFNVESGRGDMSLASLKPSTREARLREAGFVKARKSLLAIGGATICADLKRAALRYTPATHNANPSD